ncbi:hypothetical protein M8J77_011106 [Diaphorina citri]|nr:hypothetical protein M8J77_011106 [Diaphorina citri]
MNNFSLIQWNVNGYFPRLPYLQKLLSDDTPLIVCLQETNFKPTNNPSLPRYNFYRTDRDPTTCGASSGGVATLVHKSISAKPLNIQSDLEVIAVKVFLKKKVEICNIYIPSDKRFCSSDLENISRQLHPPFIIVGDLNSHNVLWGSSQSNSRGKEVEKWFTQENLFLLNDGRHTYTSMSYNTTSAIDLAFCSNDLGLLLSWNVRKYLNDSDHFPIDINSFQREDVNVHCNSSKWHFKRADWNGFYCKLREKHENFIVNPDTECAIEEFTQDIISACEDNIPRSNPENMKPRVPWWTEECYKAIKNKNKCYRKYKSTLSPDDFTLFKRARAISRKTVWQAKRESWRNFIGSININTSSKEAWQKVKRILGKKTNQIGVPCLLQDSQYITDKKDVANILNERFHKNSDLSSHSDTFQTFKELSEREPLHFSDSNSDPYNAPITMREIERALNSRKDTSPGIDKISYVMLKKLPRPSLIILNKIYNRIWYSGIIPEKWKVFILSPILKPQKNPEQSESYRPICLASCLFKLLEKIVNDRLYCTLNSQNFFNKVQCGFRKLHSTADALVHLESYVRDAFISQEHCVAVSLDISRAYETTWIFRVLKILQEQNIKGNLMLFIQNLHQNRKFVVRVGSVLSDPKQQPNGICQGLSISCTLFLIAINDIVANVHPKVESCIFADDCTLFTKSKYMSEVESCLQQSLNNLCSWSNSSGFLFSPQKSRAIHFCRKRRRHNNPNLSMLDQPLLFVPNMKLLGLHFDTKLKFKQHLTETKSNCLNRINLMKIFCNKTWGADYKTLLQLYRSYVRSKLDYACVVYNSASSSSLKTLDTIHHQGIRLALGAFKSSPIPSILSEAGEPPLSYRREILTCNYLFNTQRDPNHFLSSLLTDHSLQQLYERKSSYEKPLRIRGKLLLEKYEIEHLDLLSPSPQISTPWLIEPPAVDYSLRKFNKDIDCKEEITISFQEILQKTPDSTVIYTDGSKNSVAVSSAFCSQNIKFSTRLHPLLSICNAELTAILFAINLFVSSQLNEDNQNRSIIICSDSLSSLQTLQNNFSLNPIAAEIRNLILKNKSKLNVQFIWVPSHVGIAGNEEADRLAKEALTSAHPSVNQIPIPDYKAYSKKKILESWNSEWHNLQNNKLREIKPENKPWNPPYVINRKDQVCLIRLRIGHTNTTHVHLMKRENPPICVPCGCRITVKHILNECQNYSNVRTSLNLSSTLLSCLRDNDISPPLEFLRRTQIKI